MQVDTTTRVLLAGILICLIVLILQNVFRRPVEQRAAPVPVAAVEEAEPPLESEGRRNKRGQVLSDADIVVMAESATNEALPLDLRVWAALQLEGLFHPHVSETLIGLLDDEHEVLAIAALQALAGHRDPRILEAVRRAAEHEDESVRIVARYVMERSYPDGPPSPQP